jgi:hypothetical protein
MKNTSALSAAAVALLVTSFASPAFADSDTLRVGVFNIPLSESDENPATGGSVSISDVMVHEPEVLGAFAILLTEPGSSAISDIVIATISLEPVTGFFKLGVKLTSDGSVPLTFTGGISIPETGEAQDLTPAFDEHFGLSTLPIIQVTSDLDVPEPSTWALMALGFGGLGLAGWRARRRSVSIAA